MSSIQSTLRRLLAVVALVAASLLGSVAHAGGIAPYTAEAYGQALQSGAPVLLQVHAEWCPTCRAQAPVVKSLVNDPKYANVTVLVVDFDRQKDVRKQFNVSRQSTLVLFAGGQEVARATGITSKGDIGALLDKAL
ncbi:thioredoxin family protein [Nevskia sp.]|uniref:thioredoxin family protein n=1 Tax=Nevskia sp. TaxID=1929292 RepID=UPI0025E50729|nr:thioredoxin family protein [Nevskia sp.]